MSYEAVNRATPAGMVLSEDGTVLNWRGVNYVRQDVPTADGPISYDREAIAQAIYREHMPEDDDAGPWPLHEDLADAVIEVLPPLDEVPADDASTVGEPPEHVVEAVAEWLRDEYGVYGGVAKQEAHHLIAFIRDAGGPAAPSDEVLIDDTDYVSWSDLAEYAANQKRAADEARREAKNYYLKLKELESAVTEPMPTPTMTNDFTDAAAWQAEEELESYLGTEDAAYGFRDGFARGADWARTHLAAEEPDEATQRLARAAFQVDSTHHFYEGQDGRPTCVCGFVGDARKRTQTEHITTAVLEAFDHD